MFIVRVLGILVLLAGLILIGISGDNHRVPNGRNLVSGLSLMVVGGLIALLARQVGMLMGWTHP
jgi:hypothetical protein